MTDSVLLETDDAMQTMTASTSRDTIKSVALHLTIGFLIGF